jgi:hypothetical protein
LTSQIPSDVAEAGAPPLAGAYRRESTQIALRPKPFPVARPRRLNRRTTAIAASIGLAAAVAAFWVAGNDEVVGPRMTVPVSPNQAVAELSVVQTPAPTVSPGISTARDVADPASVNAPVGNATGAAADRAIKPAEQPRAAKTTRATRSATIARSARAPKRTGSQTAANKGAQQTRESAHLAKRSDDLARQVTEAALQARHAARVATEAAHRADQAAHRANLAALQAERAARQASWGLRVQLPWKGLRAPRSAS